MFVPPEFRPPGEPYDPRLHPPAIINEILHKHRHADEQTGQLKMRLYALQGNLQSAIARLSGHPSGAVSAAVAKLNILQGQVQHMLDSVDLHHVRELSAEAYLLSLDFLDQLIEDEKTLLPKQLTLHNYKTLDEAINDQPLIMLLDSHTLHVAGIIALSIAMGVDLHAVHAGAHHFTYAFAAGVAWKNDEPGRAEKILREADAEVDAEEKQEEAKAATEEQKSAIRRRYEEIKARIHSHAISIRDGGQERIRAAYSEFVEEPMRRFAEHYSEYQSKAAAHLGDQAQKYNAMLKEQFDALRKHLQGLCVVACVSCNHCVPGISQNNPIDLNVVKSVADHTNEICMACGHALTGHHHALYLHQSKVGAARRNLAETLAGKACISEDTTAILKTVAQMEGQPELAEDIYGSIHEFHKKFGVTPTTGFFRHMKEMANAANDQWAGHCGQRNQGFARQNAS